MLNILYRDRDIAVCIKPVGFLSEEDGNKQSMPKSLKEELSLKEIFTVHRLDKNVSGVMIFALNKNAASSLAKQIEEKSAKKVYLAVIKGALPEKSGNMFDLLFRDASKNKTYVVQRERKGVRDASLDYEILAENGGTSLARIMLHTGRTHQIRVQFASRGVPLIGDGRYGSRDGKDTPALFSHYLEIKHPKTKKIMHFSALPQKTDTSPFYPLIDMAGLTAGENK